MMLTGTGLRLSDTDLPAVGHIIGVGEDEIHALIDVESAGSGWDGSKRLKMLFEPHIFYKYLKARAPEKLDRAVKLGLAYPTWKSGGYPLDSYPRLISAMAIDEEIAMMSASWGLGQIMGFNHGLVGYASAKAMVESFLKGEYHQLVAIIAYLVNAGGAVALRAHDWNTVARIYNGKDYAVHGYHTKLAKAYAKWAKIKDTPWTPPPPPKPAEEKK